MSFRIVSVNAQDVIKNRSYQAGLPAQPSSLFGETHCIHIYFTFKTFCVLNDPKTGFPFGLENLEK